MKRDRSPSLQLEAGLGYEAASALWSHGLRPRPRGLLRLHRLHPKHAPRNDLSLLHIDDIALKRHVDPRPRARAIKHGPLEDILDLWS